MIATVCLQEISAVEVCALLAYIKLHMYNMYMYVYSVPYLKLPNMIFFFSCNF